MSEPDTDFRDDIESEAGAPVDPPADEYEGRARRMGWRPKEEYNGPAGRWVDAKTFVERGETELPIIRERFRKLDDRLAATERELTGTRTELKEANTKITEQSEVLTELRDLSVTAAKRGYQQAMSDLSARERRAVAEADTSTYDQIQQEKRALEETKPPVVERRAPPPPERKTPDAPPSMPPEEAAIVTQWIGDNPWFNADPELNSVATAIHGLIRQQNPAMPLRENLEEVKNRLVQRYPEKFGQDQRRRPAAVAMSAGPPAKSTKKTVADLPQDAKDALARYKRTIPGYKDTDYLSLYFPGEEVA